MNDSCQKGEGPREFWIAGRSDGMFDAFEMPCANYSGYFRAVHVIEHSAYVQLEEKLRIAVEALEQMAKGGVCDTSFFIVSEALSKINGAGK